MPDQATSTPEDFPTPQELGLPEKFSEFRPEQLQAFNVLNDHQHQFSAFSMPTGSGKSLAYFTYPYITGKRAVFLTRDKGLQDQLMSDFSSMGLVDIRGRNNYTCQLHPTINCEVGSHMRCPHSGRSSCAYTAACDRAREAQFVVTNYRYYILISQLEAQQGNRQTQDQVDGRRFGLGKIDFLVMDEAHEADLEVCEAVSIEFTVKEVRSLLHADWPDRLSVQGIQAWARELLHTAKDRVAKLSVSVTANSSYEMVRTLMEWKRLEEKLTSVIGVKAGTWAVSDNMPESFKVSPLWAKGLANAVLYRDIPQVGLFSATLVEKTLELLDIPQGEYQLINVPSSFNANRSPIYYIPTAMVGRNMSDEKVQLWLERHAEILKARPNTRGVIHAVSYQRATDIYSYLRHEFYNRVITHGRGPGNTRDTVAELKQGDRHNAVLISPSVSTGYDFPDDQCRWQIISKIPYANLSDPLTRQRHQLDPDYLTYVTAQELEQMVGRGTRNRNDWCENFIIDNNAPRFILHDARPKQFLTPHFMRRYVRRATIPNAPRF